ncbi:MAG: hypothetical protein JW797_19950 [Bradymonadales bacterium]|nr:hypothetical protein [Bradymonadales bacterium]
MNWVQLAYQYGLGGLFFFVTLALCFQSGAGDRANPSDKKALVYLLGGLLLFFLSHLVWILLASS